MPLRLYGRWLAVIIAEPWKLVSGKTMDMNIAGVVAIPQLITVAPPLSIPSIKASESSGPETRESRPTPIFSSYAGTPLFFSNQLTKAQPICLAIVGVRFTFSPSTPSTATPRISLPFCNFNIFSLIP